MLWFGIAIVASACGNPFAGDGNGDVTAVEPLATVEQFAPATVPATDGDDPGPVTADPAMADATPATRAPSIEPPEDTAPDDTAPEDEAPGTTESPDTSDPGDDVPPIAAGEAINDTLEAYAGYVNVGRYAEAYDLFSPEQRARVGSLDDFVADMASTQIAGIDVQTVSTYTNTEASARVGFVSTQDAALGPNGQTCSEWTLDYDFVDLGTGWLIDGAKNVGDSPNDCSPDDGDGDAPAGSVSCAYDPDLGPNPLGMRAFVTIEAADGDVTFTYEQFPNADGRGARINTRTYEDTSLDQARARMRDNAGEFLALTGIEDAGLYAEIDRVLRCR